MEFYSLPVEVEFDDEPLLEKKSGVPDRFSFRGRAYTIVSVEGEWHTYEAKGKTEKFYGKKRGNMPEMKLRERGSWGVGKDYYRVKTDTGEVFVIYYDRQPTKKKKGEWILLQKE